MAKAMASPVAYLEPVSDDPRGTLRAFTSVHIVDINGNKRVRRVSLGAAHYRSVSVAQESLRSVRADNSGMQIHGQLVIDL